MPGGSRECQRTRRRREERSRCRPAWHRGWLASHRKGIRVNETSKTQDDARYQRGSAAEPSATRRSIMSEPVNGPPADRSGIGETITTALRQPSILRVMLGLAATVVVLVGMRLAAPILNPILFAVVLSLLFSPIYAWLIRHRIPTPLALIIMLVGLTVLFVGIFL